MTKLATQKQLNFFKSLFKKYELSLKCEYSFYGKNNESVNRDYVILVARELSKFESGNAEPLEMKFVSTAIDYMLAYFNN